MGSHRGLEPGFRARTTARTVCPRLLAAALAAGVVLILAAASPTGSATVRKPGAPVRIESIEQTIVAAINHARDDRGLPPLHRAAGLQQAANAHGRSMALGGYFSHTSPSGASASARIRRYYHGARVGEMLLWRSPDVTAEQALQMWLGSPTHRALLLDRQFAEIGLSAIHVLDAPGSFGGRAVTILVADLGRR